jgi:hypothetical protein
MKKKTVQFILRNTGQRSGTLKMAVFWVVAPCSLVEVYQHFRGASIIRAAIIIVLMMKAARTSETLVNFYQTTLRYNPEDSNLHTHRRENLKSYNWYFA